VEFKNGEARRFSMLPYLDYPAYCPLKDTSLFMKAHVENGTVTWTEDIDVSPDTLYIEGFPYDLTLAKQGQ
jgi:hypothetical protein